MARIRKSQLKRKSGTLLSISVFPVMMGTMKASVFPTREKSLQSLLSNLFKANMFLLMFMLTMDRVVQIMSALIFKE